MEHPIFPIIHQLCKTKRKNMEKGNIKIVEIADFKTANMSLTM